MPPPPAPSRIDPDLLAELGALSVEDHCRRFERHRREVHEAEVTLGRKRKHLTAVARALAARLVRDQEPGKPPSLTVDGVEYLPHRDMRGIDRVKLGDRKAKEVAS